MRELQALMELVLEGSVIDGLAAGAGTCGIASLNHEAGDDAMEYRTFVVALQTQLNEIAAGQRCLSRPQFDVELAVRGVQDNFARGGRLLHIVIAHRQVYYKESLAPDLLVAHQRITHARLFLELRRLHQRLHVDFSLAVEKVKQLLFYPKRQVLQIGNSDRLEVCDNVRDLVYYAVEVFQLWHDSQQAMVGI